MHGRVASLLEVGTGFHPELTGRENIFLNGAILGMSRAEIRSKFDEIVAFAEVERFLDTPVKRYSSGMYVRLAFAVAAHLEPEILIVDEVLAVGDAQFQKKCLGRMREVAQREERTVIFVSHNMAAVSSLCNRVAFLEKGRLVAVEQTDAAISRYAASNRTGSYIRASSAPIKSRSSIRSAWIEADGQRSTSDEPVPLRSGDPFDLVLEVATSAGEPVEVLASFFDHLRRPLWMFSNTAFECPLLRGSENTQIRLSYRLPAVTTPQITIDLAIGIPGAYPFDDLIVDAITCPIIGDAATHHRRMSLDYPFVVEPVYSTSSNLNHCDRSPEPVYDVVA
jgi:lipopolysaccharide transport system ATP-binding protein